MEIEKRGVPTVTILTEPFTYLGRIESEGLAVPALPVVAIPHPLLGRSAEALSELARLITQRSVYILTTSSEQLEAEFAGWYQLSGRIAVACDDVGCMPVYFAGKG